MAVKLEIPSMRKTKSIREIIADTTQPIDLAAISLEVQQLSAACADTNEDRDDYCEIFRRIYGLVTPSGYDDGRDIQQAQFSDEQKAALIELMQETGGGVFSGSRLCDDHILRFKMRRKLETEIMPALFAESRPESPTVKYCLGRPKKLRWNGEAVAKNQHRLFAKFLIESDRRVEVVPFSVVKQEMDMEHVLDKRVSNLISEVETLFNEISFPWHVSAKKFELHIDRSV